MLVPVQSRTVARPIPLLPPVMTAIFPSSAGMVIFLSTYCFDPFLCTYWYRCSAHRVGFIISWTGREIPSFFILEIKVVRFRPSRAAAPFGPPIIQPAACSACRIHARWESLKACTGVPTTGFELAGPAPTELVSN